MIAKVISGGQTGADEAGVKVARWLRIPTGGTMPKGWRTQDGPRPEYEERYGMVEHASSGYGPRTFVNVADADLTEDRKPIHNAAALEMGRPLASNA